MRATALYPTQSCLGTKDDDTLAVKLGSCRKFCIVHAKPGQNAPRSFRRWQRPCEILAHVRMLLFERAKFSIIESALTPPSDVGPRLRTIAGVQRVALAAAREGQSAL